ncbi:MAG TPA: PA2778 family cysteine peptidase [Porticoccaceae bacterium]|nr:PA2778 family cysteine peptidase [Porticoccaceae bacterium]
MTRSPWLLAAAALLLAACSRTPILPPIAGDAALVELSAVPFFPQSDYQCGPAALATVLNHAGAAVTPEQLVSAVYLPGRGGSLQVELIAATRRQGLVPYPIGGELPGLIDALRGGRPVLVLQNLGTQSWPIWHFAVVIGYDARRDALILRSGTTQRELTGAHAFARSWGLGGNWGLLVLSPGDLPAAADAERYLRAVTDMEGVAPPAALVAAFAAAVERWPDNSWARVGLGNARYEAGDRRGAAAAFAQVIERHPGLVIARNNLAHILGERGCRVAALALLDTGLAGQALTEAERAQLHATRAEVAAKAASATADCPDVSGRSK